MEAEREVHLFRNGRNQAVRIPREFELPGKTAIMRKVGDRLILEPGRRRPLLELLAELSPLAPSDEFPDVDDTLPELDAEPLSDRES